MHQCSYAFSLLFKVVAQLLDVAYNRGLRILAYVQSYPCGLEQMDVYTVYYSSKYGKGLIVSPLTKVFIRNEFTCIRNTLNEKHFPV